MKLISKRTGKEFGSFSAAREWALADAQERYLDEADVDYKFYIGDTKEEAWLNIWCEYGEWVGVRFEIIEDPAETI